jgi:hypothetical protein
LSDIVDVLEMRNNLINFFFLGFSLILVSKNLYCQNLVVHVGCNYGNQFAFKSEDPHVSNEFEWGAGYSFGVSLNDFEFKSKHNYTFYLGFESFGGEFYSAYSGLGGGSLKSGNFQKYVIDFEFYPWKISAFKKLSFSPGFEINGTVGKNVRGTYSQYQMGTSIPTVDLKDFKGVIGPLNIGTNFNLSYEFKHNRISVYPSYKFSIFFLPELNLNTYTFSHRHSFLISLGYALK